MICDITRDIVKICKELVIEYESPSKLLVYHYILQNIFEKLKKDKKITVLYIDKSKVSLFFKEIQQLFKNFPIYTVISNEIPEENDELQCILFKYQQNITKNIRKLHRFLIKHQLSFLNTMFTAQNIGIHCVSCQYQ